MTSGKPTAIRLAKDVDAILWRAGWRRGYRESRDMRRAVDMCRRYCTKVVNPTRQQRELLFAGLATSLALLLYCDRPMALRSEKLSKLSRFGEHFVGLYDIEPTRQGCNAAISYTKACIADRHERDYHKYGQAIMRAARSGHEPLSFYKALCKPGGLRKCLAANT